MLNLTRDKIYENKEGLSENTKSKKGKASPSQRSEIDDVQAIREQNVRDVLNKGAASASANLANILGFSLDSTYRYN